MQLTMSSWQDLFETRRKEGFSSLQGPCWEAFSKVKSQEALQYVPLHRLENVEAIKERDILAEVLLPECRNSFIVFVDGVFRRDLSCLEAVEEVRVLTLEEALQGSYASFLRHRHQVLFQQETDPFALLNGALCQEGLFLYIPPKVCVKAPLQFLFLQQESFLPYTGPRIHLFIGSQAQVQLVNSIGTHSLYNGLIDLALEEGAIVSHVSHTLQSGPGISFEGIRASLKKDSVLRSFLVHLGKDLLRQDYRISLLGPGADADLRGVSLVKDKKNSHIHVHMDHTAPSCRSYQLFKQVLAGLGKSSFTGKIYVRRAAQKTMAYQLQKSLLLSEGAMAYAKPGLEILADDVKASHGSTTSQLDEQQLHYLQSRGIPRKEAAFLLMQGFYQEVLESLPLPSLREKAMKAALIWKE
ncbi:MAG: SufD family Fe-S cluster assembly protein [Chlamydiae bacterium]|nr:SufD family Fe-S cluster assembly protein [Chlamydiota bacterium]